MKNNFPQLKTQLFSLLLLTAFSVIVYFSSLKGGFQYDDTSLLKKHYITDLETFRKKVDFFYSADGDFFFRVISNRPTLLFTFALNNDLNNKQPFGFHLVNLSLHICVAILVFYILRLTERFLRSSTDSFSNKSSGQLNNQTETAPSFSALPLLGALLFALHPLTTDSVTYISSRSSILMTFFYLLCVYGFLQMFSIGESKQKGARIFWGGWIVVGFYLAVSSKLTAVTLPATLALFYLFVINPAAFSQASEVFKNKTSWAVIGIIILIPLAFLLKYVGLDKGDELYGGMTYFFAQFKVILFYYLRLFLWPINLNVDVGFPFSTLFTDYKIALSIVVLTLSIVWILKRGQPLICLAAVWFILTLAPTSSFVPLNDLAVEHRLYLPMTLGLCLIAGRGILSLNADHRLYLTLFLILSWGILTSARNLVWIDEMTLWRDSANKNVRSGRPLANLAKTFYEKKDFETALELLEKSIAITEKLPDSHYNLGNVYMDFNRLDDSERAYKRALELKPRYEEAWLGLGSVYNQKGLYQPSIEAYRKSIEIRKIHVPDGDYPMARLNLGEVYGKMGQVHDAIRELNIAIREDSALYKAYYNLGTAYMKLEEFEKSKQAFLDCLKINSTFEKALFNLAHLHQKTGDYERSNQYFHQFLEVEPNHSKALFALGVNAVNLKQFDLAKDYFGQTIAREPQHSGARINLGNLLVQEGRMEPALDHFLKVLEKNPNLFQLQVQVGLIYAQHLKDKSKGIQHLQKALDLSPNQQVKNQISQLIAETSRS